MTERRAVWVITGVSSGLGRELARCVLDKGETVVGTVRQRAQCADFEALAPGRAHGRVLDVTHSAAIEPAISAIDREFGGIDVLVNNAGFGLFGAVEEFSEAEARRVMETNFFGLLNVTRAVLPGMRSRGRGHIVNVSSIAGLAGMAGVGLYCASKFAVTGLSESLASELAGFGIRVTVVEPGGFRTEFSGGSFAMAQGLLAAYESTPAARPRAIGQYHGHERGDPRRAAEAIVAAVRAPNPPLHLLLGPDALEMLQRKQQALQADLDAWDAVSRGTNFTE